MKPSKYEELVGVFGAALPWASITGGLTSLFDFGLGWLLFGVLLGYLTFDPLCKWYGRWFR